MSKSIISILLLVNFTLYASQEYKELDKKQTYLSAITECKKLGASWRLPEIWELFPLKGKTKKFGKEKRYWSKTSLKEKRTLDTHMASDEFFIRNKDIPAFAFYLQDGDITPTSKSIKAYALCTNLPKYIQDEKYFKKSDKGVEDSLNAILWEPLTKENRNIKVTYEEAQDTCDNKTLNNREWRLPTLDELYSIVNYGYVKPSLNQEVFSKMQNKYYWSDDIFVVNKKNSDEEDAYVVGFSIGSVATSGQNNKSFYRCVSDLEE